MAAEDSRKPRPDVLVPTDCCLRFTDTVARSAILALSCVGRLVRHAARRINTLHQHAVRMYIHTLARAKLCPSSREQCAQRSLHRPSIVLRVCPTHALRHASERSLKTSTHARSTQWRTRGSTSTTKRAARPRNRSTHWPQRPRDRFGSRISSFCASSRAATTPDPGRSITR